MDQNVYEVMLIFNSSRFVRNPDKLPKEIEEMITSNGGEVLISRLWEDRKLAYPIRGQRKGTYWLIYFRANPDQIKTLNRQCEINENILRQLVLKVHPHLEEPILAHARGEVDSESEAPEAATETAATETAATETAATETAATETAATETAATETAAEA